MRSGLNKCSSAALAALLLASAGAANAATATFVYKGAGCDGLKAMPAFETMLGRKADGAVDFVNYLADWPGAVTASKWGSWCWKGSGYRLAWSVPLAVSKGANASLTDVAAGKANTYYQQIAADLVANGHADAYIRLGWEFNGGWYPWGGHNPTAIAAAFRQAHDAMASVSGAKFRFVWNPALYEQGFWPDQAYPGDAYVDLIATDAYNTSWSAGYANPSVMHSDVMNASWGINEVLAFAKKHNKPYAFPEWGTGYRPDGHSDGDDAGYINMMGPLVKASEFSGYWDFKASDFNGILSDGSKPLARAAFVAQFSGPTGGAPTPSPTPPPAQTPAPAQPTPPAPTPNPPQAAITAKVSNGGTVKVESQPDGSAYLDLTFPLQSRLINYVITISAKRKIGWSPANVWYTNNVFTWQVPAGKASSGRVWVGAK